MKKCKEVDEAAIRHALKEGLITAEEARVMLMVYVNRPDLNLIRNQMIMNKTVSNVNRL